MRRALLVLCVLLCLVGCPRRSRSGVVTGTVTYKDRPVNGAALLLYPAAGGQAQPFNVNVDQEGTFRISDLPAGEYKIVVEGTSGSSQVPPEQLRRMSPAERKKAEALLSDKNTPATIPFPNKYKDVKTTDLKVTITDSDQKLDLVLHD